MRPWLDGSTAKRRGCSGPAVTMSSTLVRKIRLCSRPLPCTSISTARNGRVGDVHVHLLRRRHEVVLAVGVLAQHAGEQLDQRHAADGSAAVDPHAVGADLHADVAAVGRIPLLDRRRALALPPLQQGLEPGNAVGAASAPSATPLSPPLAGRGRGGAACGSITPPLTPPRKGEASLRETAGSASCSGSAAAAALASRACCAPRSSSWR